MAEVKGIATSALHFVENERCVEEAGLGNLPAP